MNKFETSIDRLRETERRMADPNVADNFEVRLDIMRRVKSGEITLEQGQAELKAIQKKAKKNGTPTVYGARS